ADTSRIVPGGIKVVWLRKTTNKLLVIVKGCTAFSNQLSWTQSFKVEVQLQLRKKIKVVKFYRDGEYYAKYDASREQHPGSFALFLIECGIVPQYIMSYKPSMNSVIERRNRILKDMVRNYPTEALPYRRHERKLDSRTISCYFVGYVECYKGYKFYDPTSISFFEKGNAKILEEVDPCTYYCSRNNSKQDYDGVLSQTPIKQHQQPQEVSLRRSIKERRHAILDDYIDDIGLTKDDPINFCQAMKSSNSQKWIDAMKDEMKSLQDNDRFKTYWLNEYLKPKKDSKGNIERYKTHLVAKDFTQKEDIDYKETFSSVSLKDSFRTTMTLVVHFDLELHQMDIKTVFLNGDIDETIYMVQPKNFFSNESKSMFSENKYIFLVLYVDDILLASSDTSLLHETKRFMMKNFEMEDLEKASFILGI
ncbi:hypothetical protein CR513_53992, partial [Mucuna pruriens]